MTIHPSALISSNAIIEEGVIIGPFSIIHNNVILRHGTEVQAFCEIGVPTPLAHKKNIEIGCNSLIRSHSVFYEGSSFGERLVTGHRVTVRENTTAGTNFQIGTLSDIQGHCNIGDFVRLHSNVHVGQKTKIGDYVWIFPYVVITNDPHPPSDTLIGACIEDYAVIATMSVILPGARVSKGCLVGAHSCIKGSTEENYVYAGSPAKKICPTSKIKLTDGSGSAYPWTKHFHRGYPEDVVRNWSKEL